MLMNILKALVISLAFSVVWGGCPAPNLIAPCKCESGFQISCEKNSSIDLFHIFELLDQNLEENERNFYELTLKNTSITEIKANTTKRLTFERIYISHNPNLTKIDVDAFGKTALVTNGLTIGFNENLGSINNSIFELAKKFVNLTRLDLSYNNFSDIPARAFARSPGYKDRLTNITISGNPIKTIENKAFSSLNSLKYLEIYGTEIENIPEFAFEIDHETYDTLFIKLSENNKLFLTGFHEKSLVHFKRPVTINIGDEIFAWRTLGLDETVLGNFLKANVKNKIDLKGDFEQPIDCSNCKSYWLKKNPDLLRQVLHLKCKNNKDVIDPDNFKECDKYDYLKPCRYEQDEDAIYCEGTTEFDLQGVFKNFLKHHPINTYFRKFYLSNKAIQELPENALGKIGFFKIWIENCSSLKEIHKNAFNGTFYGTDELIISNNTKLSSKNIFELLSNFRSVKYISLNNNDLITEIPSNAFNPIKGYENNLKALSLFGKFIKIGSNSFYNYGNLSWINFDHAQFKEIPENAFAFKQESNTTLVIDLGFNPNISSSVFREKSLVNIKRPTSLRFGPSNYSKQVTYLDEKVFLPFLMENGNNTIELMGQEFDCNDCRNYWIKKQTKLVPRLLNIKCGNNKGIIDPDNFKNCS